MSRYADIEPIIKKIKNSMEVGEIRGRIWFEMVLADLEKLPTVDAVPVVHGHWIKIGGQYSIRNMKCSICGEEVFGDVDTEKYCFNCGAKMDKEE